MTNAVRTLRLAVATGIQAHPTSSSPTARSNIPVMAAAINTADDAAVHASAKAPGFTRPTAPQSHQPSSTNTTAVVRTATIRPTAAAAAEGVESVSSVLCHADVPFHSGT